jgi:hypothetical protein
MRDQTSHRLDSFKRKVAVKARDSAHKTNQSLYLEAEANGNQGFNGKFAAEAQLLVKVGDNLDSGELCPAL